MVDYLEILRLRYLSYPKVTIAYSVHSSRNTIREVFKKADELNVSWPLDDSVTNYTLEELFYPERYADNKDRLIPDYPKIHRELARKGVTLSLLWTEYCAEAASVGKKPYMSTQFNENYHKWAKVSKATMRIQHKPGDTMEVDWAGSTIDIYDAVTGEITPAYLFVAALSCSNYVYAEACPNMQTEAFIKCHIHAYEYFGGVPRLLVPDNLKAGVTKNTRFETIIPKAYREMSDHYGTAIVPARPLKPDDKPNAEGEVKFATTWIIAALRNCHFFSLDEAREEVKVKLEELNTKPFTKRVGNRRLAYENEEKAFMQPLPTTSFELAVWSSATVQRDYLISDGINKYSVPFNLIGEKVDIRLTGSSVEVFYHHNRVASHIRIPNAVPDPVVKKEHMPVAHQKYLSYTADGFRKWASEIGRSTEMVVDYFLTSGKEPEQGYKYCASLLRTADRYGNERLEKACERLLSFTTQPSLRSIVTILKNGQDKIKTETASGKPDPSKRSRGITRGADAYGKEGDA